MEKAHAEQIAAEEAAAAEHEGDIHADFEEMREEVTISNTELEEATGPKLHPNIYRQRLQVFLQEKAPEKVDDAKALSITLEAVKGREEELFVTLVEDYGPSALEGLEGEMDVLARRLWDVMHEKGLGYWYAQRIVDAVTDELQVAEEGKLRAVILAVESDTIHELLEETESGKAGQPEGQDAEEPMQPNEVREEAKPAKPVVPAGPYQHQKETLISMGFEINDLVEEILVECKGKTLRAVHKLHQRGIYGPTKTVRKEKEG